MSSSVELGKPRAKIGEGRLQDVSTDWPELRGTRRHHEVSRPLTKSPGIGAQKRNSSDLTDLWDQR